MRQSQRDALQAALVECQRFVRAAKKAIEVSDLERCEAESQAERDAPQRHKKWSAATKRESMNLTRALARFRNVRDEDLQP